MNEVISFELFSDLLRETFDRGQEFTFIPSGTSMLPLLNGTDDKVTFSPKPAHLSKYDVALYRRPSNGHLVLHRMIGFTHDGGYIFCGDNQFTKEFGITDDDVLALMTAFTRKGKTHSVRSLRYRIYCRRIVCMMKYRRIKAIIYHKLKDSQE